LTLVSGVTSVNVSTLSPEKSVVTTPGRSTSGSSSLLSFERHERSVVDLETPQTLRNSLQYAEMTAISASPARDTDNDKSTDAGKDAKAVSVRFLLPAENAHRPGMSNIIQGIL